MIIYIEWGIHSESIRMLCAEYGGGIQDQAGGTLYIWLMFRRFTQHKEITKWKCPLFDVKTVFHYFKIKITGVSKNTIRTMNFGYV